MPLQKDPEGGGTNADGTKSTDYCSFCFKEGKFCYEGDMASFRDWLDNHLKEKKMSWFIRKLTWWQLPTLKRWNQQKYV